MEKFPACARGGYEISETWGNGKLISATVKNVSGDGKCQVRYGGKVVELSLAKGEIKLLNADLQ